MKKERGLGLVLGVLVQTENGIILCDETPEPLREGDFVGVLQYQAKPVLHLQDKRHPNKFSAARTILKLAAAWRENYLLPMRAKQMRERLEQERRKSGQLPC